MYNARAIATKVLYLFMAVIIATGGFFAGPPGAAQAVDNPFRQLTGPTSLPGSTGYAVAFSENATYLAVGTMSTPFLTLYKRSGVTFDKLTFTTGLTGPGYGRSLQQRHQPPGGDIPR